MCGICGIVDFNKTIEDGAARVSAMNETLRHRGPDDDGVYARPFAALAMRRLSVIDVEGGHQPMQSPGGALTIVYNGETYNFTEIRDGLQKKGHSFKTASDTEVILKLYEERGADCLQEMNGMFAFAILDENNRRLFLTRDRLGVKPLYYHLNGGRIYFASEIKALLAHPDVPKRLDLNSLSHYLAHLYVPGERTIFQDIKSLPPGTFINFDGGACEPESYWSLDFTPRNISEAQAAKELEELLADAVRLNLVSDVPIGAFLSGGIDSSAITALMSLAAGGRVKTFSIGFEEERFDERAFARTVAERYGTEHEEFIVKYPSIPDFLPKMSRCFDQPFADAAAIPAFTLAQNARKKVTVALSGNGGDELFGGYTKYLAEKYNEKLSKAPAAARRAALSILEKTMPETANLADRNRRIKRMLRYSLAPAAQRPVSWTTGFDPAAQRKLLNKDIAAEIGPSNAFAPWLNAFNSCASGDVLSKQQYTDIKIYLPDNNLLKDDITGMANSLETRVPLLDHRIVEFAASLPSGFHINGRTMKYILKKAVGKLLPDEIIDRPKQGFTVPVGVWINGGMADYANETLLGKGASSDYFDRSEIKRLLSEHRAGRADNAMRLWALIVFNVWRNEYFI